MESKEEEKETRVEEALMVEKRGECREFKEGAE